MSVERDPAEAGPGGSSWYRRWFGEDYLRLYPHRDREEAREAVRLLLEHTGLTEDAPVLDLACGEGRHLEVLLEEGLDAVGLDLSQPLLRRAKRSDPSIRVVRGDMRSLPFETNAFAAVVSFFTSFGYFDSEEQDRRVLREIRRVLRPNGVHLLDFLNADSVARNLSPRDERTVGDRTVIQERRLVGDGRVVEKRIRIEDEPPGETAGKGEGEREFVERVRLYRPAELVALLASEGLHAEETYGDYGGGPVTPSSPRVIVIARSKR